MAEGQTAPLPLPKSQPSFGKRNKQRAAPTILYITLRQQDYALLMGAIALFIVLTIVMYVTRKVDWYARDAG